MQGFLSKWCLLETKAFVRRTRSCGNAVNLQGGLTKCHKIMIGCLEFSTFSTKIRSNSLEVIAMVEEDKRLHDFSEESNVRKETGDVLSVRPNPFDSCLRSIERSSRSVFPVSTGFNSLLSFDIIILCLCLAYLIRISVRRDAMRTRIKDSDSRIVTKGWNHSPLFFINTQCCPSRT